MAVMYTAMVFGLAELGSALPTAGGGYTFARRALGPVGRLRHRRRGAHRVRHRARGDRHVHRRLRRVPRAVRHHRRLVGLPGVYALFVGIHLLGVGEALKAMFAVTVVALAGLVVFLVGAVPRFDAGNLLDIAPTDAAGASAFLPYGLIGIWAAFPFAIWFFLAVESVPLAAEEARDPARSMPRGSSRRWACSSSSPSSCWCSPRARPGRRRSRVGQPAGRRAGRRRASEGLTTVVNYAGLFGLVASFFSIIYAYSRQTFALSRAGYLPARCR
jgi:ethanolamine permease